MAMSGCYKGEGAREIDHQSNAKEVEQAIRQQQWWVEKERKKGRGDLNKSRASDAKL